ncbi:MAG: RDD family protein [Deltaproteobacteria bacterium]|nr:RDD family protein [Deltaproteobacteria bacterium]MBW2305516.1 RDD family protein [Deltaproteobacteria bacterium]
MDSLSPHHSAPSAGPDSDTSVGTGPGDQISSPEEKDVSKKENYERAECTLAAGVGIRFLPCRFAGFAPRLIAFILDLLLVNMLAIIFTLGGAMASIQGEVLSRYPPLLPDNLDIYASLFFASFFLVSITYFTYFHGVTGQTVGKMFLGLRVVGEDGCPLGYKMSLLRWIGYFISGVFFSFGFLWVIIDRRKQAWHDKLAGSLVIWS